VYLEAGIDFPIRALIFTKHKNPEKTKQKLWFAPADRNARLIALIRFVQFSCSLADFESE